ncbi:hypothetical protein [Deinococcus radiopugnans]|uniref:Uncharacterized protein n=2 Tax=Deinococcus radiopugnans TaxID=57497 RepID=A0A5C4Y7T8_9DEIO|nr:hypothetical protein [Deinococcus radiopugnans]MBB6017767.1 hypothetical protein [Deinococcus radiopugnans ATCC 19172]TNM71428.1 hypothetical protein FHR04_07700 [Deinococcus radiopugnans ATCC 19172]
MMHLLSGKSESTQTLTESSHDTSMVCSDSPIFSPIYKNEEGSISSEDDGFSFKSTSVVQIQLCSAGVLSITGTPDLAGNEPPRLTVSIGTAAPIDYAFSRARTIHIKIHDERDVFFAFLNDYYRSDIRKAVLSEIDFEGSSCKGFQNTELSREKGDKWDSKNSIATLISAAPLIPFTLVPCGPGKISMVVQGHEGKGVLPVLAIYQNGMVIANIETTQYLRQVKMLVSDAPITIVIRNPYVGTLADRNLHIRHVEFIPNTAVDY